MELPWLDAVEVSASRGFLATYVEESCGHDMVEYSWMFHPEPSQMAFLKLKMICNW